MYHVRDRNVRYYAFTCYVTKACRTPRPGLTSSHLYGGTEPRLQILIATGILPVTSNASYSLHATRKRES